MGRCSVIWTFKSSILHWESKALAQIYIRVKLYTAQLQLVLAVMITFVVGLI